MANTKLILASGSTVRAEILRNAGVDFDVVTADIDERAIERSVGENHLKPADLAELLGQAKASTVSGQHPEQYIIGADQTLSFEEKILHKAGTVEEARSRLLEVQGKVHHLNSAVCLFKAGSLVWSHVSVCALKMRTLTPEYIGRYLSRAGSDVLSSVGVYQIEKEGVQLFEKIEGDMFSIMGLPLLPLLDQLRKHEIIEA